MNIFRGYHLTNRLKFLFKGIARSFSSKESLRVFGAPTASASSCIDAAYIINLDRQLSRWTNFMAEARRLPTHSGEDLLRFCHRVAAIDGKLLNEEEAISSVTPTYPLDAQYYVDPDPRLLALISERAVHVSMSREEIAVALSHIKAWRRIVAENRSYALVLEDDVFFESEFAGQLNRSWHELPKNQNNAPIFDFLYLSFREVERGAQTVAYSANLCRPIRGYWWLSGYVLSRDGAKKLLNLLPVIGPVDLWMNHRFSDLNIYSTPRSIISQRLDLQSDNRYSILPLLSQIGVQSDKTHLVLERTKGRRPIFGIGFDRESAAVLESALSLLGYRCCNDKWGLLSANVGELLDNNLPLLFDAYIHVRAVSKAFMRVADLYPDAVFIMPHVSHKHSDVSQEEYQAVKETYHHEEGKLLTLDVHAPSGWHDLCRFLRCEKPAYPFPVNGHKTDTTASMLGSVERLPIVDRMATVQEHDVHPWIVPYERMSSFGVLRDKRQCGLQAGLFKSVAVDNLLRLDASRWTVLEDSFPSNRALFRRENIAFMARHGCRMTLTANKIADREYAAASLMSIRSFHYGRFEVTMKAARAPGVVTAFFLHRINPWQEIDMELLGRDTTKILLNVYFNPGDQGTKCNFGNRGTPVLIDLTFDAAEDEHRYAIEWEPHEVRWFVDDQLIHARGFWEPTPVPHLPMDLYVSIWPPASVDLAGELKASDLPVSSDLRSIELWDWCAPP